MARRVVTGFNGPTAEAVKVWLGTKLIDPKDVLGWAVRQRSGDVATIDVTLYFDDVPAAAEKEASDG